MSRLLHRPLLTYTGRLLSVLHVIHALIIGLALVYVAECDQRPNIVFILTDDQDVTLGGLEPMVKLNRLVREQGVFFDNAFVHTPICCPSRSSYLTGKYIHNHGAVNNSLEGNCASLAWQQGSELYTFASSLQGSHYQKGYFGKYLNSYGTKQAPGGPQHIPRGWDTWFGLVGNSKYYNYSVSNNGVLEEHGQDYGADYFTDMIKNKSVQFIKDSRANKPIWPFLLVAATPAPHAPFTPAPQYEHVFDGHTAPRTPNWNHHSDDKHWLMREQVPMTDRGINASDEIFQHRWETLLSVDDLVEAIVQTLVDEHILENTYIIFASDHGFQMGQFCIGFDKRQPYEHDIRIPLMIRGPGIAKNVTLHDIALNIDIAPTIVALSGQTPPPHMDGRSLTDLLFPTPSTAKDVDDAGPTDPAAAWRDDFLIDYHGEGRPPCWLVQCPAPAADRFHSIDSFNNTYTCLRTLSSAENSLYCEFTMTGFAEYFDLTADPWQLTNTAKTVSPALLKQRQARLAYLRKCSGAQCHLPSTTTREQLVID
eukprot:scpid62763/ scgid31589/ N-acetylglucosamine-6-sulfatase; Glucosamine-6-sulfatase